MNHYEVLEVQSTASQSQIKIAYRKLVKQFHPDINPDPVAAQRMILVNEAYEILSNATSRRLYDQFLQGVPVKTDIQADPQAQRYREEYLKKKARLERERIIFLVKLKTRFYRYERLANMMFFVIGILMTLDYYYQPEQLVMEVREITKSRFETRVITETGERVVLSREFHDHYIIQDADRVRIKYSLFFDIPARVQIDGMKEDFIVNGSLYTFRNVFSIIILLFSAVVVGNREYTDFRLSCGLVPCFLVLFLLLFVLSEI